MIYNIHNHIFSMILYRFHFYLKCILRYLRYTVTVTVTVTVVTISNTYNT